MDDSHHFSSAPQREGFEALLQQYVSELPQQSGALAVAASEGDVERVQGLLHQLAGSLGLYGFRRIEGLCRAQLARLKHGETLSTIAPDLDRLRQELGRVRARPAL